MNTTDVENLLSSIDPDSEEVSDGRYEMYKRIISMIHENLFKPTLVLDPDLWNKKLEVTDEYFLETLEDFKEKFKEKFKETEDIKLNRNFLFYRNGDASVSSKA